MAKPRIVAWLGYGGLLPFITLSLLACLDRGRGAFWNGYLVAYGAVILSFVGALHWGLAMVLGGISDRRRDAMLTWSVVPALIGFSALIAHSVLSDLLLLIGFLVHVWQDHRLSAVANLPAWYLPLRLRLSAVALVCVAAGAASV